MAEKYYREILTTINGENVGSSFIDPTAGENEEYGILADIELTVSSENSEG